MPQLLVQAGYRGISRDMLALYKARCNIDPRLLENLAFGDKYEEMIVHKEEKEDGHE